MNQPDAPSFQMTGRQQLVHRSLIDKSEPVALLYECSLRVLADSSNPGRVLLAAHSIREMMGGLPKVLELPVLADQGRLADQINALEPIWNGAKKSKCHQEGEWAGEIDGPLQNLLKGLQKLFQWWRESRPRRRDVAAQLFLRTDPAEMPLPETLEKRRVNRWLALLDFFRVRCSANRSGAPIVAGKRANSYAINYPELQAWIEMAHRALIEVNDPARR